MSGEKQPHHPSDAVLGAFVDGHVEADTRGTVLAHLETCNDCMAAVLAANAQRGEAAAGRGRAPSRTWLAAAAILIALVAVPLLLWRRDPMRRLVALAPHSARVVEPRLTGGFDWAEYAGAPRAAAGADGAEQMKLAGAAGELVERADRRSDAESQHAAGVALVLVQRPADGIARLEAAASRSNDARTFSDLAAARYAAASQLGRASLYPSALAAAEAALRLDPNLPEALFNRALIVERLGLAEEARRAWQRYLEVDSSSPWAAEARAHLAELQQSTRASQFDRDRPLLERAAETGDEAAVRAYVSTHLGRARAFAESEYLGSWGDALQGGRDAEAARWLAIARRIGDALVAINGETQILDAVHAIDVARDRRPIAAAHVLYRSARIAYSRGERDAALRDFLRATELFTSAGDPMSLLARYYVGSVRLVRDETASARVELERVRAEAHPRYLSLGGRVRWELGRMLALDRDWSAAAQLFGEGAELFRRSGEHSSQAFVEGMRADALVALGREDEAWLARQQGFAALSSDGATGMLANALTAAAGVELRSGHRENALALSALALSAARGASPQVALESLLDLATLQATSERPDDAAESVRQARLLAYAAPDASVRERNLAMADVAEAVLLAERDPRAAIANLTRAIDFYAQRDLAAKLPDALLLRSRCLARTGGGEAATRDRERGMTIVERHRPRLGGVAIGVGALDAEHALYEEAIVAGLDRGDVAGAFAAAERSRGAALTTSELQRRLAGSGTVVLEIVALPRELITFAISADDAIAARRPRPSGTLAELVEQSLVESGTAAAAALYDDVIRPVDALLGRARAIVIVPDRRMETVPFPALYDSTMRRHLIERFAVSIAASAGSLSRDEHGPDGAPALATVELPSGGGTVSLPEAVHEVREIAALYARVEAISERDATFAALQSAAARADVVHVAGHTERQRGGGEAALLFHEERVSSRSIVMAPPAPIGVLVLAACETLRPPASPGTRALSLGGAFSVAGAREVIGTLSPVNDRDARRLFAALHRRLAAGRPPAEALREAQLEAIGRDKTNGGRRAWRAVELLTRRLPAS